MIEHPAPATWYAYFDRRRGAVRRSRWCARRSTPPSTARRLARTYGGEPGCALLAPGVPGYDETLDTDECPYGDPSRPPDLAAARALIDQAGCAGARVRWRAGATQPSGRSPVPTSTPWTGSGSRRVPERRHARSHTGIDVLAPEPPRALGFFAAAAGLDDPLIAGELDRLGASTEVNADSEADSEAWRALDRYAVSPPQSYVAPLGHPTVATFFSERMDPAERGLSSRVSQRLLELAAEGGRVARGREWVRMSSGARSRTRFSRLS